ncbi:MAG: Thiamine import ATP-binding protein ThiQ [Alphaproteobacteria bacterium MarineAlpha9_Bin2]|nr:MAG: Thiamine import ATP-binding protein ThiQ [Alphaproteobacteria bacterium MarineAlpha9_Bin1]PPR31608.1 MAG: Thiamine import ATP-binding protein ThiQ [Alphaproteobacteria bacterium MarineAlpha9_Bin2]
MINRQLLSVDGSLKIKNKKLLDDFSLIIEKGRWTTILGQSGVGKSTLLKLIAGLEIPGQFRGNIKLDSANHKIFSWMAQNDLLLPWLSVTKNVCLGQILRNEKLDHKKAEKLLKAVELENISIQLPDTLSVGMRQRVALARTLMEETEIVLMDEPFSSLDYITRSNIQNLSRKLLKNKTVIMVTHDPTEALLLSDNLLLIENQKLTKLELPNSRPMRSIKQKDFSEYYEKTINRLKQAYIVS